jgi:hypothetical protein
MRLPIKPEDINNSLPDEVIEIVNNLIQENWQVDSATFLQTDMVALISRKLFISRPEVYDLGYTKIEDIYRNAGWKVEYNKPGPNDCCYPASFTFTKKK